MPINILKVDNDLELKNAIASAKVWDEILLGKHIRQVFDIGDNITVAIMGESKADIHGCARIYVANDPTLPSLSSNAQIIDFYDSSVAIMYFGTGMGERIRSTANIIAHDQSFILSSGAATIRVIDSAMAVVRDEDLVYAFDDSKIVAMGNSLVHAFGRSRVWVYDNAKVCLYEESVLMHHDQTAKIERCYQKATPIETGEGSRSELKSRYIDV